MAADRFPMFRLATLLARQLSSPIASRIKSLTVSHPRLGAAVCVRVASVYNTCEWRVRALALRLGGARLPKNAQPPPLPRKTATDLGADLIGEIIIFILGSLIVIFEVNRQAAKQEVKELEERSEWLAILFSLEELQSELVIQQREIESLRAMLLRLQQQRDSPDDDDAPLNQQSPNVHKTSFIHTNYIEPILMKI